MSAFLHNLWHVALFVAAFAAAVGLSGFVVLRATERFGWRMTVPVFAVLYVIGLAAVLTWAP